MSDTGTGRGVRSVLLLSLAAVFLARLGLEWFLFHSLGGDILLSRDCAERVWLAWRWSGSPTFVVHDAWLPLSFWLLGSVLWILPSPEGGAVFAGTAAAAVSLLLLYAIGRRLFRGFPYAALLPLAFVAAAGEQVWVSLIPTFDIFFSCLILAGLYFSILWNDDGRRSRLWPAIVCFSLSTWVRYEGILFCLAFVYWLVWRRKEWRGLLVFICPFLWGLAMGGQGVVSALRIGLAREVGNAFLFPNWITLKAVGHFLFLQPPLAGPALLFSLVSLFSRKGGWERDSAGIAEILAAVPLLAYVLSGILGSVIMLPNHLAPFELAVSLAWGNCLVRCLRHRPGWLIHGVWIAVLTSGFIHASQIWIPRYAVAVRRDPASEQLGRQVKPWADENFSRGDSILAERPVDADPRQLLLLHRYWWIWRTRWIPHSLHADGEVLYLQRPPWDGKMEARPAEAPSLFARSAPALADWLAAHRVRLVVAQNRLGREKMAALAGWERACRTGGYDLYLKKGESGRESLLRRLEEADRR